MADLNYIASPVDVALIKKELTKDAFIRVTGKLNNEIYIVNFHNAPNTIREVGRLRELTFASADGGTGKEVDLDNLDVSEYCYQQLIVWNPEEQEIVGGYRFIDGADITEKGDWQKDLSMSHYFQLSEKFISEYLPFSIELGRSWVQPKYQPVNDPRKGMFALDNIWDGLGAICLKYKHIKYFYGKVTMYPSYNENARNYVLNFLKHYFPDNQNLMTPLVEVKVPQLKMSSELFPIDSNDFAKSFRIGQRNLSRFCNEYGESIPPLIKQYMALSPSMMSFGTFKNNDFGNVEETGILIPIDSIYEDKKERYIKL